MACLLKRHKEKAKNKQKIKNLPATQITCNGQISLTLTLILQKTKTYLSYLIKTFRPPII